MKRGEQIILILMLLVGIGIFMQDPSITGSAGRIIFDPDQKIAQVFLDLPKIGETSQPKTFPDTFQDLGRKEVVLDISKFEGYIFSKHPDTGLYFLKTYGRENFVECLGVSPKSGFTLEGNELLMARIIIGSEVGACRFDGRGVQRFKPGTIIIYSGQEIILIEPPFVKRNLFERAWSSSMSSFFGEASFKEASIFPDETHISSEVPITATFDGRKYGRIVNVEVFDEGGKVVAELTLYDDGNHNDGEAGDGIFSNNLDTASLGPGNYMIDILEAHV